MNPYKKTVIHHVRLYTSCISNTVPLPDGWEALIPIAGWTGLANCSTSTIPPTPITDTVIVDTVTGYILTDKITGYYLIEA